jgi:amino acid adenylation domain-containing protein
MDITIEKFENAKKYWLGKLSGDLTEVKLIPDFPRTKDRQSAVYETHFNQELTTRLNQISKNNDLSLYVILVTVFKILLFKVTDQDDIITASPTLSGGNIKYNRFVVFRDHLAPGMVFKDVLMNIKQTVSGAYKHQYYPMRKIIEFLNIKNRLSFFRFFLVLESIHNKEFLDEAIGEFENDMIFSIKRNKDCLEGEIIYNACCFRGETVQHLFHCYLHILSQVLHDYSIKLSHISLVTGEQKKLLLFDFNNTKINFSEDKILHQLFADQVEQNPDRTALVGRMQLSYRKLNERSNQLAHLLIEKGVTADNIIGIMIDRSIEMIIGILGILKSGGAYLPIEPDYPGERINYILADSGAKMLVTTSSLMEEGEKVIRWEGKKNIDPVFLDFLEGSNFYPSTLPPSYLSHYSLAYVIYTSGSTGKPKGVVINHCSIVNTLLWRKNYYQFQPDDVVLQIPSFTFDSSVEDIFTPLISGSRLIIIPGENRLNLNYLRESIEKNNVTHFLIVPGFYNAFLEEIGEHLRKVKFITVAGESFGEELVTKHFATLTKVELYNEYGPTENSVCATVFRFTPGNTGVSIGKPIDNVHCYVLNRHGDLTPIGIPGQLFIAGKGLSRGYLNNPELTARKFHSVFSMSSGFYRSYTSYMSNNIYRTGDMARWLPDGNIEFLGRMDFQVKISGYRVELGEIESHLLKHPGIKEVAVVVKESGENKYLCAYFVLKKHRENTGVTEIIEYLGGELPDYMIPSYFASLEQMPLTPGGKIDRKALKSFDTDGLTDDYTPPRDRIEEKLARIWSELLRIDKDKIGIDSNFFELGGQSLNATILVSRIYKEFDVKVPLQQVFKNPLIREISTYIKSSAQFKYTSIEPVEKKEYYILSPAQKRMYIIQQMILDNTAYNVTKIFEVHQKQGKEKWQEIFRKLIDRHESLRTSFQVLDLDSEPVQMIPENVEIEMEYFGAERKAQSAEGEKERHAPGAMRFASTIKDFIRPFDLSQAPLFRVGLIRIEDAKYILIVDMHHIISDGISLSVLMQDWMMIDHGNQLPSLRIQYKDYSEWQNSEKQKEVRKIQNEYWLEQFKGELPVLNLPKDYSRPEVNRYEGGTFAFEIPREETKTIKQMALNEGTTVFMVVLSIFYVFLAKLSGQEDIIIGTGVAGRNHADLERVIGMFVNMLVLRNFPQGHKRFRQFLPEVKKRTLEAFENREFQYEDLVDHLNLDRTKRSNPLFDVAFSLQDIDLGTVRPINKEIPGAKESGHRFERKISKYDLTLNGIEIDGKLNMMFEYSTKLFKQERIERYVKYFKEIVTTISKNKDIKLRDIKVSLKLVEQKLTNPLPDFGF